jgi:fumarate hydratase subunit alpha
MSTNRLLRPNSLVYFSVSQVYTGINPRISYFRASQRSLMREIESSLITSTIARLFIEANYYLNDDALAAIKNAIRTEKSTLAREVLQKLLENAAISAEGEVPLCQDCGSAVVFLEIGQDVHVTGGDLYTAVNDGVKQAYEKGYLRKSVVRQPFSERTNTRDNTPAIIYTDIVPGEQIRITAVPKGGGSENMSRLGMLTPAQDRAGVVEFVVNTVDEAGSNPCPPLIVGVGIGGTAERAMLLAKKALLRPIGLHNEDTETAELEKELLEKINALGIGPMGYGGSTTALAVNVEVLPAHLASLPVAVNLSCHSIKHKESMI